MTIKILFLILINISILHKTINADERKQYNEQIITHITKINMLNKSLDKIERIKNTYNYIKKYFIENHIQYKEHSLQEIGFIGYSHKAIHTKIKGKEKTIYNIIIPIETQYKLKNNLAIAIAITLINNFKNKEIKNSINIYFIEDDSHKQISTINSRLLLNSNTFEKDINTIYLMLNEDKRNNLIEFKNQSNIINSKTNLSFLKNFIQTFENNKVNFSVSKITNKNINEIYNLYLKEKIPILIISNNKEHSLLKYIKENNPYDILFLSSYLSILFTNKMLFAYENIIDYDIINPVYLVNFFLTLFNFNLISYFAYNYKIHLNLKELKYLAISTSIVEFIIVLYIKIEFILITILKNILILMIPNKIKILKKLIIIFIWVINLILITSIQTTLMISRPIELSYFIAISLFSAILANIVEHLKHKTTTIKQEFQKSEKIEFIILLLIIAIIIISYDIEKIATIKISQTISFPEHKNEINVKYLQDNKNTIQLSIKDLNLKLDKNQTQIKKETKIQEKLIDVSFHKIDAAERSIYTIKITTTKIAEQIHLYLENASELIVYQSNTPYKIVSNNIIFTANNIKSNITNITFTIKCKEDIKYNAFAYFDTNKNEVKIYDQKTKKK
ncbi:putative membrane spanning protein [Borrelia duttonii CR2A]|uniref:Putative membrane spanning protein n=1 Tax=Borrelia duttonii CR2A TaxID=1432657 RepID=W6TLN6_9SPIR|nr:putative membrane spanning protein [Borrelia duttonii CR2A]